MASEVVLGQLSSRNLPEAVEYAVITPPYHQKNDPLPLCLILMGGGGSRQNLIDCRPLFDSWWADGSLAPMIFTTPSAEISYYVEDPASGVRWDSFIVEDFLPHLRSSWKISRTLISGISMGGYGALKIGFAYPEQFGAVAAMNPMMEPGYTDAEIGARNRIHHTAGGPARLIGSARDPDLFAANQPANRVRANAGRIRELNLPIYLEAGDNDFLNAHDGAEFLHRVLWDLDISHEYHLVRGGDHGGSTFRARMHATYAWLSAVVRFDRSAEPSPEDRALQALRQQLQPVRDQAAQSDPTTYRRLGRL
ncbi:MAG TPA: alpha/beta hydrolase-fold protein [Bryobacteraceae bacterium]|nr:alpha/beta hydrolase-fold protein [Bryobacteraceae bacterium]